MEWSASEWHPRRGQLIGKIIGGDYVSEGGIVVVSSIKKKKPRKVQILVLGESVGDDVPGFYNDKEEFEAYRALPGQTAWFKMAEGIKIRFDRQDCLILENEDIVAVED